MTSLLLLALAPLAAPTARAPLAPLAQLSVATPEKFEFQYFAIDIKDWHSRLELVLTQTSSPAADLYLSRGALPTRTSFDLRSTTPGSGDEAITLDATSAPAIESGLWYAGVWHPVSAAVDLDWSFVPVPSSRAGLGALPYEEAGESGTSFRVWAPNALDVHLTGAFDGWSASAAPMAAEAGGNWSLDVRQLAAGAQYRYVIQTPTETLWKNDPRARAITNSLGNSIVLDPAQWDWGAQPWSMPPWNELVLYELHVGTFEDTPGGPPGSLWSARQRLAYLQDLGVNAIELMPVMEFPADFSWGYNPSHPFAVEVAYGGVQQLQLFVREAHEHGIAVLLDVVYNHFGPSDLDLWRFDGWSQAGYGGIYFYNSIQAQTPWGDTRPDFGRGEVRQYLRDNALWWLEGLRLDGLRLDSTSNIRLGPLGNNPDGWSLMQWINDEVDASQPWKLVIAEDMYDAPNDWITKDTGAGGAGFDSQWEALFVHPLRAAVETGDDNARNMWAVHDAIAHTYNADAFERVIYTESHDEVANGRTRVPEAIWPGNAGSYYPKKRSTLAAALVMTSPGIPMLFQGQEILEDGFFADSDPVDWSKLVTFAGIQQMYKDMIALRRNQGGVTAGLLGQHTNVHHVDDTNKLIAFQRWDQGGAGDDVIVVANFANRSWSLGEGYEIGFPEAGDWQVRFNSDWSGYDTSFGNHPSPTVIAGGLPYDGLPARGEISIGPYSVLVLSR